MKAPAPSIPKEEVANTLPSLFNNAYDCDMNLWKRKRFTRIQVLK